MKDKKDSCGVVGRKGQTTARLGCYRPRQKILSLNNKIMRNILKCTLLVMIIGCKQATSEEILNKNKNLNLNSASFLRNI